MDDVDLTRKVVFTNAKILILKLITTIMSKVADGDWVVFTNAKILILKLITTLAVLYKN